MQTILVAGAGKSSVFLIQYLLTHAAAHNWQIVVADGSEEAIREKTGDHPASRAVVLDITDDPARRRLVAEASLVVSLMPPHLHLYLAKDCLEFGKNLITSSYVSPEIRAMDAAVREAGLMFMCEMGLDPGIDHMTASELLHRIREENGTLTSFKSYCGGLIAPESDNNPWHYKFTWNPRNIITAGADGAHYLERGTEKSVDYLQLFRNNEQISVEGIGNLAYYANRDSLNYLTIYDVPGVQSFLRATLRHPDFCKGWDALIRLGLTSMTDTFSHNNLSYAGWISQKTGLTADGALRQQVAAYLGIAEDSMELKMLDWLGLFSEEPVRTEKISSGELLLELLLGKWAMEPEDKDMVIMQHEVAYEQDKQPVRLTTTMVIKGDDREHSAMAKTVGLPMGVLARMVMTGKIAALPVGVQIPNMPEIYQPVLAELADYGIVFHEKFG